MFALRCYEVGPDGVATMATVANLLQETAANHAQALWGPGAWVPALMAQQSLAFALSKLHVRLQRPLVWGAGGVRVRTWFAASGAVAARRDWELVDAATGALLGAASSTWVVFSLETRRLARMPPPLRSYFDTSSQPAWALGAGFAPERCAELSPDAPCLVGGTQRVRRADVDMNGHTNNAAYISMLLDDVPPAVAGGGYMASLDVEYRSEAVAGEELRSRSALHGSDGGCLLPDGGYDGAGALTFQHALVRLGDGAELLRARTVWVAGGEGRITREAV